MAAPVSDGHLSQHYFVALLKLISHKANQLNPELPPLSVATLALNDVSMREDVLLHRGLLDIMWAGTNDELEAQLLPVKVPIVGGLMGYRVALVHKDNLVRFNSLAVAEIKQLDACQGTTWTDSDILEANGFNVKRAQTYAAMPRMLIQGRCDYFPRGLHEAYIEAHNMAHQYPELTIADRRIFKYHLAAFMFLNKQEAATVGTFRTSV